MTAPANTFGPANEVLVMDLTKFVQGLCTQSVHIAENFKELF